MPEKPRRLHLLDDGRWRRLDRLLNDILSQPDEDRQARLRVLAGRHPELAAELEILVTNAVDERRLDEVLLKALEYLSGVESMPAQRRLGAWRLLSLIGHGGMAQVFLAERADGAYRQQVAIKLMWPGLASAGEVARFHRERQLLAGLGDHRIARLLDGGVSDDGRPWLAMEYVPGVPIDRYCRQHRLAEHDRLQLFSQVAGAVSDAHRHLAIHGDIKPRNVLVTEDGRVKLLDFGIGHLLSAGADHECSAAALTPRCASPEQRQREPVTTASDVYQLGGLLLELMTGQPPGDAAQPAHPSLSRDLLAIIECAMAADPRQRYPTVDALESDVQALLANRPLQARGHSLPYRLRCFAIRNRLAVAAGIVVAAGLVIGAGMYWQQSQRVLAESEVNRAALGFLEHMLHAGDPYAGEGRALIPEAVLDEAAERAAADLSDQPRVQARIYNVLGRIRRSRGEAVHALEHLETARAIAQAHDLREELVRSQVGIAMVGIWSGDYASAQAMLTTVLAEQLGDPQMAGDAFTARVRLFLADLLHSRGFYDQAESAARETLASGHHPAWANRVLGMILRDQGRFEESGHHLRQAIRLDREALGEGHSDVAIGLEHYGQLLLYTGRREEAREALEEAFRIRTALLGDDWDGLIWTRHWLGLGAFADNQLERARDLLKTTVAHYRDSFSQGSHLLAFARSDQGWVELARGDRVAAVRLFHDAVQSLDPVQPQDHPRIAEPLLGLAVAALADGDLHSARTHAGRALSIRRRQFGPVAKDHPWIVSACRVYIATGGNCTERTATGPPDHLDWIRTSLTERWIAGSPASPSS